MGNLLGSSFPEKSHQGWRDPQWPHQPTGVSEKAPQVVVNLMEGKYLMPSSIITEKDDKNLEESVQSIRSPYQEMVRQGSLAC